MLAAAIGVFLGDARATLEARRTALASPPPDHYYGVPPAALRSASLGFREALADILWVRAALYFGLSHQLERPPRHIALHMEAVLGLAPYFERAYSTAAALTQYRAQPRRVLLEEAIGFLERGAERFPEQWRFPFFIGAYYLQMPARDEAERQELRLKAADWVQRAALLGAGHGAPSWLANLAATVRTELGEREMALRYLEEMLLTAPDEATRRQVRAKIMQLAGRIQAERFAAEAERFQRAWRESYPYVSADLFVLLGERREPEALDLGAIIDRVLPPPLPEPAE